MWRTNAEQRLYRATQKRAQYGLTASNVRGPKANDLGTILLAALVVANAPYAERMARAEQRGMQIETRHARQSAIGVPVKIRDLPGVQQPIIVRED